MFKLSAMVFLLVSSSVFATDLSGTYTYSPDEGGYETLFFPGEERQTGGVGYQNYTQPPTPIYAKIPMKTEFTLRDCGSYLKIRHLPLTGAYALSQIGAEPIISIVSLEKQSKNESIKRGTDGFKIKISEIERFWISGRRSTLSARQLGNGDIQLVQVTTGWAPIPAPIPAHYKDRFTLKRLGDAPSAFVCE